MTTSETTNELPDKLEEKPLVINNKEDENNYTDDSNSDDSKSECSSENEENVNSNFLFLNKDKLVYLLCKDDQPLCYFTNKKDAYESMWKYARFSKIKYINDFNTFIKEEDENTIFIVGYNRFLIISYERLFSKFHITTVNEMDSFNDKTEKNVNDTLLNTTVSNRWWG